MKPSQLLVRVDELIALGQQVEATLHHDPGWSCRIVDKGKMRGFRTAVLSFIERHYGREHTHYVEFSNWVAGIEDTHIDTGMAILSAIRGEVSGGWLSSIKTLISAEIFSDFIEMADHLLASGYKDAAAVMIGSVLEEHLRQLASIAGVELTKELEGSPVPKKAEMLNAELAKAEVYTKLDQKAITTWLDLRNKAAHGKYSEYQHSQVEVMRQGVLEFMVRITP